MNPSGGGILEARPYSSLASSYGRVMAHVDYSGWWKHLWRLGKKYGGIHPTRILELGSGHCPFPVLEDFPTDVFSVHTDLSYPMLTRCQAGPQGLPLRVASSMSAIPFRCEFDWVIMIYDSLNYQLEESGIALTFREALRVLRPGGILLFDVTTASNSVRHFSDTLDYEDMGDCVVIRASTFEPENSLQINDFTLFVKEPDGRYQGLRELHRQRIYSAELLSCLASQAGFEIAAVLANFSHRPGSDKHERLHFVLRKPNSLSLGSP
jgi:SAM-dependent methyltransferase